MYLRVYFMIWIQISTPKAKMLKDVERSVTLYGLYHVFTKPNYIQISWNINNYDMVCISLYLTISHCIFLTCRSYTPNKHPFTASLGFPNRSRCSACRSMMNLGESFGSTGTRTEYLLVRKTRREWMGHDGLLGLGLWFIDSVDHSFENSLRKTHQ